LPAAQRTAFAKNGEIIRVDNTFVHAEITKRALMLLCADRQDEFLKAYDTKRR
jgi:hypothetical protein